MLDASDPTNPTKISAVSGGADTTINSVSVREDGLAVATVEPNANKTLPGQLVFFDAASDDFVALGFVKVGSLPDMVTISPDGNYALVANEGEPAEDYSVDPEGSISVVALRDTVEASTQDDVHTADFRAFEGTLAERGVHIFGQVGASTTEAQNIEPEYIAAVGNTAYASLQENNAIAVIDIPSATVTDVWPLGYVDRMQVPFDASDRDGEINITNWPVKGIRQPDSIGAYEVNGQTYIVTANEGDARDWEAYSEEARLKDLGDPDEGLAPLCEGFNNWTAEEIEFLQSDEGAGRLKITTAFGYNEEKDCFEEVYAYGGRGFSIFTSDGTLVYDSADQFERVTADTHPEWFNSNHSESNFEGRSDDKGPEPEGLALGTIGERTYAFIGNERVGGVMVYDITNPSAAEYVTYVNNRDFSVSMEDYEDDDAAVAEMLPQAGDLGPEGLVFIPAADSPNGKHLLVVGNEVSGTTTIFQVDDLLAAPEAPAETPGTGSTGESSVNGSSYGGFAGIILAILGVLATIGGTIAMNPQLVENLKNQIAHYLR